MTSNIKHQKRVNRMLSKYGQLKDNHKITNSLSNYNDVTDGHFSINQSKRTERKDDIELDFFNDQQQSSTNQVSNGKNPKSLNCNFRSNFTSSDLPLIHKVCHDRKKDGFLFRWTGFKFLNSLVDSKEERHRPIFTYWLMLLEVVIFILLLSIYGIGYFGFYPRNVTDIIWHQSSSFQEAFFTEAPNLWLGPSPAILIREGAVFSPCMNEEKSIKKAFQLMKQEENNSGCCIRLDNSGCVQSARSKCSKRTSIFIKSKSQPGPVCGQDPAYCVDTEKSEWSKNITDWPICHRKNRTMILNNHDNHMRCRVQARPCCTGIYGKCVLSSKEYCEFVRGTYNPKATLCSQVNCMKSVCGLFPFEKAPNQLYRLFLSLFLHAGVFQILITLLMQYKFMSVIEETFGTRKIIALYFISGIGGNLSSALFLPAIPEIGPMGALFGILSLLMYYTFKERNMLKNPILAFFRTSYCLPIFMFAGLFVNWINNFSNIFGFIFGILTVFLIAPENYRKRLFAISASLLIFLSFILFYLFYNSHLIEPYRKFFNYLNCIPITKNWCMIDNINREIRALN